MKKRIICFGDSNTWGYNPTNGSRFDENTRWPMVLQKLLGDDYQIIEEAQNGRTIANADPWEWGCKCGMDYILPMLESHKPFDLLIIMLGSNDLKAKFHLPAGDIAGSLQNMLMKAKSFLQYQCAISPKILIVSPPYLDNPSLSLSFIGSASRQWPCGYELVAKQFTFSFLPYQAGDVTACILWRDGRRFELYSKSRWGGSFFFFPPPPHIF